MAWGMALDVSNQDRMLGDGYFPDSSNHWWSVRSGVEYMVILFAIAIIVVCLLVLTGVLP